MSGNKSTTSPVSSTEAELYFLIARFLSNGPCKQAADALLRELGEHELLPKRIDWEGNKHTRTYDQLVQSNSHISTDYLLQLCSRVGPLLDQLVPTNIHGIRSLLGAGNLSLLRTPESIKHTKWQLGHHIALQHGCPLVPPRNLLVSSFAQMFHARTASGACGSLPTSMYSKVAMHDRKLGHLSAVYCVSYDRTGNYIFTGADDALVKIWHAHSGRLLATLRGHSSEITDMAVNFENTLLATGSCDKMVRVWCLRTKAPVAVLHGHTGAINTLQFSPQCRGDKRILVSTGADGCVCFWVWSVSFRTFSTKPIKFVERSHAGAQMLCASFSPGGMFLATGNSDHVIRVYFLHAILPEKICELEAHTNKVDSMCYSNNYNRFVSGSEDGTARIWRYERQEWRAIVLNMATKLNSDGTEVVPQGATADKLRVTMVCWSLDDSLVMTAVSDFSVKVWDANTGKLWHVLQAHHDEVFVLEGSPVDSRIVISAGHDGHIIIWDVVTGVKIKSFFNNIQGQGYGAVYDCKFTPDGQSFAATDSHGHLLFFGFGSNEKIKQVPQEVYFHTDYRPLIRDTNSYVLDEQTQQPPHLMPPPFLVNIDGNPYPPILQRLVPGRENLQDEQLVPEVAINEAGDSEVIGDGIGHPDPPPPILEPIRRPGESGVDEDDTEDEDGAGQVRDRARPSIDEMIRQLQREQDQRILAQGGEVLLASPPSADQRRASSSFEGRVGMRRSGETEGVRQSLGNVSQRATSSDLAAWRKRVVVRGLDSGVLKASRDKRQAFADEEVRKFIMERKKKPSVPNTPTTLFGQMSKGKQLPVKAEASRKESEHEVTARNRLTTRALYDTEEEEEEEAESDGLPSDRDSDSSDYSDWTMEGSGNLQPPKRRSQRKPKHRHVSSSDDDDDEDIVVDDDEDENGDDEDDDDDDDDHVEFKVSVKQNGKKEDTKETNKKKAVVLKGKSKSKKPHKQKEMRKKLPQVTELKEEFRPPEWLTGTVPRKTPYVPQMGDEVMYFRQGHELYLQAVQRHKTYELNPNMPLPWQKLPLREMELVKIVGIRYEVKPPRLCSLKLAFINADTGKLLGRTFSIRYHDMPDVIDFLVLRQHFDIAYKRKWKPGDRFRSMIDDQWWMGMIESQSPLNPQFPDSHFQSLYVHWDNGEYERLSPWDMEPINESAVPNDVGGGVPIDTEELKGLLYTPKPGEWSSLGREVETVRILRGIEAIMEHSAAEPFNAPVDLNAFPLYAYIIEYPIDLSTIKARLENGYYRRINALQWDIRHIESNAKKFNEDGTSISRSASIITETLLRFIGDKDCHDPMPILEQLSHGQQFHWGNTNSSSDEATGSSSSGGSKRKRSEEDAEEGSSKRQCIEPYQDPLEWKERCWELLGIMLECEDAEPFKAPVSRIDYPEYYTVVENPMDFRTVARQLQSDHYKHPLDFAQDVRLIFSNSRLYNTNKRSRIFTMTLRLSAMFEERMKKILSNWRAATKSRRQMSLFTIRVQTSSAAVERAKQFAARVSGGAASSSQDTQPSTSGPSSSVGTRIQPSRRATEDRTRNRPSSPAKKRARIVEHEDGDSTEVENSNDDDDNDDDEEEEEEDEEEETAPSSRRRADASDKENYNEDEDTEVEEEETSRSSHRSNIQKQVTRESSRTAATNQRQLSNGSTKYRTRARTGSLKPKRYASTDEEEEKDVRLRKNSRRATSLSSRDSSVHLPDDEEDDDDSTESSSGDASSDSDDGHRKSSRNHMTRHKSKARSQHQKSKSRRLRSASFSAEESDSDDDDEEEESDSETTSESDNDEPVQRRVPQPKSRATLDISKRQSATSNKNHSSGSGQRTTRNQGKRTVHYLEDSYDDEDDDQTHLSISSRGRVRKLTKRARANMHDD